jgi:hypothetical protein
MGSTCPYPASGRGHWGKSVPGCLWPPFKRGARQACHGCQATNPFGVFHSPPPCSCRLGERRERAAAASRRTREEPGAGVGTPTSPGTPSTRQGHHLQPPLVGRGRSCPRRGRESDRSRDPYIAGNAYLATPPLFSTRLRLHCRPNVSTTADAFSLSSRLDLCSVQRRQCWGAPSCCHAWMPAFEPQNCHISFVWSSRATHAPRPADAMQGPSVKHWPSSRARRARVAARRRVASWRALVTRQPRRANWQGRACATHAFGPRTSGELHVGPLASRAARDAAAARRDHGALLTRARRRRAWHVCLSRASTHVHVCRCVARRRAVTRRRRWHRARLPGRRAARRARDHGRGRLSGRCIPVPSRDVSTILLVTTGRKTPGPDTGGTPRGRCAAWTYRRAPGVQSSLNT